MTVTNAQIAAAQAHGLTQVEALAAACDKHDFRFYHACAILQKETGGLNIYGHDRGGVFSLASGNKEVTEENFAEFWKKVKAGATSNGVGPMQITYRGHFPIMADLGLKAWVPADNIEYGIRVIAADYRAQRVAGKTVPQSFHYAATVYNLGSFKSTWPYGLDALDKAALWKQRVGTADLGTPEPTPAQPETIVNNAVITPDEDAPPSAKPEAGSTSTWVRVDADGTLRKHGAYNITTRCRFMYLEAGRLYRRAGGGQPPGITQGGLGGVPASGATHDREALDWATKSLSREQAKLWELCIWIVGFAAWIRPKIEGLWPAHTHGIPKGGDLSRAARDQVDQFRAGQDGLLGSGPYKRIRTLGVGTQTWEDYRSGFAVSLPALQTAFAERTKHADVFRVQWALALLLHRDLVGDGDPGPQTTEALATFGPLDASTLARLGLEVAP